ncbi:hypothetical protein SESBI_10814 [Sesbania bispinosa]|nr:hypothetical protein SESBI_10814 [Sesbania bispinosa]
MQPMKKALAEHNKSNEKQPKKRTMVEHYGTTAKEPMEKEKYIIPEVGKKAVFARINDAWRCYKNFI